MGQRHLRSTVRSAARTPDAWPAWTCVLVGHRRHVRRLPVWSHDLHDRHEVRRSRHRDGRHLHRDGRHHRDASRGHHHRRVRGHRDGRWRTGRASCPGWDGDRLGAEHRNDRRSETGPRPGDEGHRDADRPGDGDRRSHRDGACPGMWRRGCCPDAEHPAWDRAPDGEGSASCLAGRISQPERTAWAQWGGEPSEPAPCGPSSAPRNAACLRSARTCPRPSSRSSRTPSPRLWRRARAPAWQPQPRGLRAWGRVERACPLGLRRPPGRSRPPVRRETAGRSAAPPLRGRAWRAPARRASSFSSSRSARDESRGIRAPCARRAPRWSTRRT